MAAKKSKTGSKMPEPVYFSEADVQRNRDLGYPDLKPNQRAFAWKYLETYNARRAAIDLGIKPTEAHLLLKHPLVDALIQDLEKQYAERSFLSKETVLLEQVELLDKLAGRVPVAMVDREGSEYTARKFHAMESTKLINDLAKQTGASKASGGAGSGVVVNIDLSALGLGGGTEGSEKEVPGVTIEHGD